MLLKKSFDLLSPNEVNYFVNQDLSRYYIPKEDEDLIFLQLDMLVKRMNANNEFILKLKDSLKELSQFLIISKTPNYSLYTYHHFKLDKTVINFSIVHYRDVLNIHRILLLPMFIYGTLFSFFARHSIKSSRLPFETNEFYTHVANYYVSVLLRLVGKKYGILSVTGISKLPLLKLMCYIYVLNSFCGRNDDEVYKEASFYSQFYDNEIVKQLKTAYDFQSFSQFIHALNDFKVFPGISEQHFLIVVKKYMKNIFNVVLFEDAARFFTFLLTYSIIGRSMFEVHFDSYNVKAFESIVYNLVNYIMFKGLK